MAACGDSCRAAPPSRSPRRAPSLHTLRGREQPGPRFLEAFEEIAAGVEKTRPASVATSGLRERSRSGTSRSPSSCWIDWLAADCVTPLAVAAREKLRSRTTSQYSLSVSGSWAKLAY